MSTLTTPNSVLGRNDLSTLNKGLSAINDYRQMLDRLEAAGLDVTEHRQQLTYLENRYNQVKQVFFPQHG